MRDAAAGVIGDAGAAGVEVFVFISVLFDKYVPKAARRYPPSGTDFDHDTAPNDSRDFSEGRSSKPVAASSRPPCATDKRPRAIEAGTMSDMSNPFTLEFLQAISDWQRGGDAKQNMKRGAKLGEVCATIPDRYRSCLLCCFRQVALPKGGVWKLIGENRLPEKISSWTLDIEIAKGFKGGVPPQGQDYQGVILCVRPEPGSVIINLRELYQDPAFCSALEQHKGSIVAYHDGAGRYGNTQSEVVLEVASVTQQDIYSMGGHSSPFEKLVEEAAKQTYGNNATPEQREALLLKAEHVRSQAGPKWLTPEATQLVLEKVKPHAKRLQGIKRLQDAAKKGLHD